MPKLSIKQQAERRTRLLDAAEACFARHGFHGTTMQQICKEAGVSAGAVYVYFPSKEALIEGSSARERAQVLAAFAQAGEASDFGQALAELMRECILEKPRSKSILWLEVAAESTRNAAIAQIQQNCESQIRDAIHSMLERAQADGRIAPVMPIPQLVTALFVVAEGMFFRRVLDPHMDATAASEAVMAMIAGLVRPQAQDAPTSGLQGVATLPAGSAVSETV